MTLLYIFPALTPISFFNVNAPIIVRKKSAFAIADLPGLWRLHWQLKYVTVLSTFYTRHDQACLLWGMMSALIFITAQFLPISWTMQAGLASGWTLIGMVGMMRLTWHFATLERLSWLLYAWVGLMLLGIVLTDLSFLWSWLPVLEHICALWLGLSGVGYGITGWGMRSRAFILAGIIHWLTLLLLPQMGRWQPLTTGIVISGTVWLIAELQWDANGVCLYQSQAQRATPASLLDEPGNQGFYQPRES